MIDLNISLQRQAFNIQLTQQWPAQGITALFGVSGCGKSSLLRCLAGLEPQCRGYIAVNGEVWQDDSQNIFLKPQRRAVALALQGGALFPHMNVQQNLLYGLRRKGKNNQGLSLEHVINMFELQDLLLRYPQALSGGETQRVAIARTLLTQAKLLLLDEPLSALDEQHKNDILPFLQRLHRELDIPIIYVSHLSSEVLQLADHLALMAQGQIYGSGALQELILEATTPQGLKNRAANFLNAQVENYCEKTALATLHTPIGALLVPSKVLIPQQKVRLKIPATAVQQTSASENTLSAQLEAYSETKHGQVLMRYRIGEQILLGRSPVAHLLNLPDVPHLPLTLASQVNLSLNTALMTLQEDLF